MTMSSVGRRKKCVCLQICLKHFPCVCNSSGFHCAGTHPNTSRATFTASKETCGRLVSCCGRCKRLVSGRLVEEPVILKCGSECVVKSQFLIYLRQVLPVFDEAANFSLVEIKQPWLNVSVSGTLPYPNLETSEAVVYHISIGHKNKNPEGCRPEM